MMLLQMNRRFFVFISEIVRDTLQLCTAYILISPLLQRNVTFRIWMIQLFISLSIIILLIINLNDLGILIIQLLLNPNQFSRLQVNKYIPSTTVCRMQQHSSCTFKREKCSLIKRSECFHKWQSMFSNKRVASAFSAATLPFGVTMYNKLQNSTMQ